MPIFKIVRVHADLSETNKQLKRVADSLVELLRLQGVHMEPLKADLSTAGDSAEVGYITDDDVLKQTLVDIHEGRNPFRAVDVDEG